MKRILVAGIGNIFMGDDAFGVEAVQHLAQRPQREGVRVVDFGIRSYDLAYALTDSCDVAILVDATRRGGAAGTVYLIEPDPPGDSPETGATIPIVNGHSLDPVQVLRWAKSLGGSLPRLYVVGCEPGDLGSEDGAMGLSEPVKAALPGAIEMIESLVDKLFELENKSAGLAPA